MEHLNLLDAAIVGNQHLGYTAFGSELIDAVLPIGGMTIMLHAYFDESGTHAGSPRMCVAGYLIDSLQAKKMNTEWSETLSAYGISRFHMQECAHGVGEFKRLGKPERAQIAKSLIELIKLRVEVGIAVSISEADFERARVPEWNTGAYTLCAQWCMQAVKGWLNKYGDESRIAYFFEAGHRCQKEMEGFMRLAATQPELRKLSHYDSHSFVTKGKLAGLDAADLLAWEWNCEYVNKSGANGKKRSRRLSLENLLGKRHFAIHWTEQNIKTWFDGFANFASMVRTARSEEFHTFQIEKPRR